MTATCPVELQTTLIEVMFEVESDNLAKVAFSIAVCAIKISFSLTLCPIYFSDLAVRFPLAFSSDR
ncbi:MAG: hypothetical protein AAGE99_00420 [Chlamydiota bacterium]